MKKSKRKTKSHGVPLRERNGRIRRVQVRDNGTPELLLRKLAMAKVCDAPGRMEISASGVDMLWRLNKLDDGERAAGERYGRLYRLCAAGPGLKAGGSNAGHESDMTEEQAQLRRMQASLNDLQRDVITDVCALMRFPEWLLRPCRERRALVHGLRVLDKGRTALIAEMAP